MSKKYINKKEVKKIISEQLSKGRTKTRILEQLEQNYYENDILRKIVAATPKPELKRKYRTVNHTLSIAAILLVGFRFLAFRIDYVGSGLTLLTLIFGITILSYEAMAYRMIAVITLLTFGRYFMNYGTSELILIDFFISALIVVLGFWLGNQLFPNYGILGPKKDNENQPILE